MSDKEIQADTPEKSGVLLEDGLTSEEKKTLDKKALIRLLVLLALPFFLMDLGLRFCGHEVHYFRPSAVLPNILFVLMWIAVFVFVPVLIGGFIGRILYALFFVIYYFMFLTNCIYFGLTGYFFSFNLLMMASEGSSYILYTLKHANPVIWIYSVIIIASFIVAYMKFKRPFAPRLIRLAVFLAGFMLLHTINPLFFGSKNTDLGWDTWRKPRNVYENFNDANKNMKICGLFEYTVRDFFVTFMREEEQISTEDLEFLEAQFKDNSKHPANVYSGIFEGKNIIILQLEGIDSWLLDRDTMPYLYNLSQSGISFTEHFSFYNGGGSTFNSELAVNTGYVTPITFTRNAYTFNSNLFPYTLPKLFKKQGYAVNAFHMNTREFYSRGINYDNWGYDEYYGLIDMNDYSNGDLSYELDRELIEDEKFSEKMFNKEQPFLDYIITYTPHTPFTADDGLGEYLSELNELSEKPEGEEAVARMFAGETDYFIKLLLEKLEENDLLENTVIVGFADHYLYTLEDKSILDKYKETGNSLINRTPMFIWSSGLESVTSSKVNSQLDVLPTILNMFGISYYEEWYIGNDIFDPAYSGWVFFPDRSYYDGTYKEEGNAKSAALIKKNDYVLKYDYFRKLAKKEKE